MWKCESLNDKIVNSKRDLFGLPTNTHILFMMDHQVSIPRLPWLLVREQLRT